MAGWLRLHWTLLALLATTASALAWPTGASWPARLVIGWDVGVLFFLTASLWRVLNAHSPADIRSRASALDQAGPAILPLALAAATASIIVVLMESQWPGNGDLATTLTLATVALSWLFIHVIFAFHYAHAFYAGEGDADRGGLAFPGGEPPDYWDFLHFSLIIGVACQTADIAIIDKRLRRISTIQSVTAFVFNTVILALAVNLALGSLSR